jgi:hypothetical protein
VAPAVGVEVGIGVALGQVAIAIVGLFPSATASDDTTQDTSQAYVFHFTSQANADGIILSGQINPSVSSGVAWVTPYTISECRSGAVPARSPEYSTRILRHSGSKSANATIMVNSSRERIRARRRCRRHNASCYSAQRTWWSSCLGPAPLIKK